MTGLQEAFYIIAICYMGIMLLVVFGALIALMIIRSKIASIERTIKEKVDMAVTVGEKAGEVISTVKKITKRKSK